MVNSIVARVAAEPGRLTAWLAMAGRALAARWPRMPALISGDADSSLLAIGRDLHAEEALFYRPRAR